MALTGNYDWRPTDHQSQISQSHDQRSGKSHLPPKYLVPISGAVHIIGNHFWGKSPLFPLCFSSSLFLLSLPSFFFLFLFPLSPLFLFLFPIPISSFSFLFLFPLSLSSFSVFFLFHRKWTCCADIFHEFFTWEQNFTKICFGVSLSLSSCEKNRIFASRTEFTTFVANVEKYDS